MSSSTAVINDISPSVPTFFNVPSKAEKVDLFYKDLLHNTALNLSEVSISSIGTSRDGTRADRISFSEENLAELTGQWRRFAVSEQIDRIRNCCSPATGNAIADRLGNLRQYLCEEEGPKIDISLDSLQAMHVFIEQIPDVRLPQISLTAEGDVYLRWKSEPDRLFSIHFLDDRRVRFAIFYPNPRHEQMINRHSGYETVDTVLTSADKICSVRDWISG
ncbi:MAG: hypothetical protein RBR67_19575 [Desulfobacterium sp.]|jgi:hypothetical protein|nr:hypothetical protein [Desulfobacterium sp.]